MSDTKHTPTPYRWFEQLGIRYLVGADEQGFAHTVGLSNAVDEANAQFIVRACNNHDNLLEVCKNYIRANLIYYEALRSLRALDTISKANQDLLAKWVVEAGAAIAETQPKKEVQAVIRESEDEGIAIHVSPEVLKKLNDWHDD